MAANTVISEERESGCSVLTAFTVFFLIRQVKELE